MVSKRVLAYFLTASLVIDPVFAQNAPANTQKSESANATLRGYETEDYSRLIIDWAKVLKSKSRIKLQPSLLTISLPVAINADVTGFKAMAPHFVVGAALSADKKTIRLALAKDVRAQINYHDGSESIDLISPNASSPPQFDKHADFPSPKKEADLKHKEESKSTINNPLKNWPAPEGAVKLAVEVKESAQFTRVAIKGMKLSKPLLGRNQNRVAITIAGVYALQTGPLRANLPKFVKDAVRYNDQTHTSIVMDLVDDAVVRVGQDGDSVYMDIFAPGTDLAALANEAKKLETEAKEKKEAEKTEAPKSAEGSENSDSADSHSENASILLSPDATQSALSPAVKPIKFEEPAPSGSVEVNVRDANGETVLEFPFAKMAGASVFRRGANIFVLFATKANFKIKGFKPNNSASEIVPVKGNGIAGVKIAAPDNVFANPSALGPVWQVTLSNTAREAGRNIDVKPEIAPDNSNRLSAKVPDAIATGEIEDTDVGDKLLVGLAMGPPSALLKPRSYLEAHLPQTSHGLAVVPRTDDLAIKIGPDGFVIVRPEGMSLTNAIEESPAGFSINSPSFVDFKNWRMGPQADFYKNLSKLKLDAAKVSDDPAAGIKSPLDLARFYLAWEMPQEALGVIRYIKAIRPQYAQSPDVIGLQGASLALIGRGREALETLTSPELADDGAAYLWSAMACFQMGDPKCAREKYALGQNALSAFTEDQQAKFRLIEAQSALLEGDIKAAQFNADTALQMAESPQTNDFARLIKALALAEDADLGPAKTILTELEKSKFPEISARAKFANAMLMVKSDPSKIGDAVKELDSLRYAWRGDDLEIEILRNLGELYIKGGDIRSGLATLADASTLRPELPAARSLRSTLMKEFRYLFMEGGADGMDSIQALALFNDFRQLTPMGPEGDLIVRGIVGKLVDLDLLAQAEELLEHQIDKRLEGYNKAQVATDLAAIYLMDNKPEEALKAIWGSRVAQLPADLNQNRRIMEAIALADLKRDENALELIEFDNSPDAARVRAEVYWRKGKYDLAAFNANQTLPPANTELSVEEAGEVLRAGIANALAKNSPKLAEIKNSHGAAMQKTAFAEAFNLINSRDIPNAQQMKTAMDSISGTSPYGNLVKNMRSRLSAILPPTEGSTMGSLNGPTDANPNGGAYIAPTELTGEAEQGKKAAPKASAKPIKPQNVKVSQAKFKPLAQPAKPKQKFQAPKDPPIAVGR